MPRLHDPGSSVRPADALREASPGWRSGPIVPYDPHQRRAGERARDAEVKARIAGVRAELRGEPAGSLPRAPELARPERCPDCGYLTTAPGHLAECGEADG